VRVSSRTDLSAGLLVMSDVPHPGDPAYHVPPRLLAAAGRRRTWGDCYGYALVASGRAEVMIDPELEVWDAAPLQPIIEEAGGRFTDLEGNPTIWNRSAVATNGHLHDQVLELLRG
jgi:fructose-1,6-bisphosphatase/inositol monophosphatase family enzyme